MKKGDFVKLVSYRENGVERRHRLLENHCDFSTPDFRHFGDRRFCNIVDDFAFLKNLFVAHFAVLVKRGFDHRFAVFVEHLIAVFVEHRFGDFFRTDDFSLRRAETNATVHDLSHGSLNKLHERKAGDRFSATRFTHDAHGRALRNVEGHAVDRLHDAVVREKVGVQIIEFDDVSVVFHFGDVVVFGISRSFLFELLYRAKVLLCDIAGLFGGYIMLVLIRSFFFLFKHNIISLPSGRTRRANRRRRS